MSRNRKGNDDGSDSSQSDEEADYIKANKAFDRENKWLEERCSNLEKKIKSLQSELSRLKNNSDRKTKRQLRVDFGWGGEEVNLSDKVSDWVKSYLFPRYKFLKDGWMEYSDDDKSLSGFVRRKMKMDMMDDEVFQGAWERVICPTIQNKYVVIRCNLANTVGKAYKGK
jgi:hypothetical protein